MSFGEEKIRISWPDRDTEICFEYILGVKPRHGGVQCRHPVIQYVQEYAQALRDLNRPTVLGANDPLEKPEAGIKTVYRLPARSKNVIEEDHLARIFPIQPAASDDTVYLRGRVQDDQRKA